MTQVPEPQAPQAPTLRCPPCHPISFLFLAHKKVFSQPPLSLQAVKVLRTAEFVPYVVFIEAPDFETLRAMNRAALESGVSTKQLTVSGSE